MSHSQFHRINWFILRHAWLNLWDKHMTTGRINQVTVLKRTPESIKKQTAKRIKTLFIVFFCLQTSPKERAAPNWEKTRTLLLSSFDACVVFQVKPFLLVIWSILFFVSCCFFKKTKIKKKEMLLKVPLNTTRISVFKKRNAAATTSLSLPRLFGCLFQVWLNTTWGIALGWMSPCKMYN